MSNKNITFTFVARNLLGQAYANFANFSLIFENVFKSEQHIIIAFITSLLIDIDGKLSKHCSKNQNGD